LAVFEQIFGYFLRVIMNLMKSILYISRNQRLKGNGGTFPQVKWKKKQPTTDLPKQPAH
jgi:hypothetical protein